MADYTEEQRVKQVYPEACCDYMGGYFRVWRDRRKIPMALGAALRTEAEAWADASRRLGNEFVDEVGPLAERKEG